jgi:streptomycin 6-kinase
MLIIPTRFAADTIAREGEAGRKWIARLPALFDAMCVRWGLVADGSPLHGYLGVVLPVRRGTEVCALKISWRDEATSEEAAALRAWDGRGAVRLLEAEPERGALLLERLDNRRTLDDLPIAEAVEIAGRLLRRLAVPAPASIRSLPVVARDLAAELPARWERGGRPLPRRLLDRACELAGELGRSAGRNLLVNYDLTYGDVLAAEREPWLAIDPKVVAGCPEYGVAQLLFRTEEMEAQGGLEHHFRALVAAAEMDPELARAWTLVRCVDYWLFGLSVGLTNDPVRCEVIISRLCDAGGVGQM